MAYYTEVEIVFQMFNMFYQKDLVAYSMVFLHASTPNSLALRNK